jgi:dienelactone hydrolase
MKTNLIRMVTSDSLRYDGLLFEPAGITKKVIIHIHGTAANFYSHRFIDNFAAEYTKAGYAFLSFNNRGAGIDTDIPKEKDGKRIGKVVIGANNEIFEDCILDIQSAADFAESKGFNEIILQGHSYGCNKVVYYALEKDFAGKLILLAPCDLCGIMESEDGLIWKTNNIKNLDIFDYRSDKIVPKSTKIKNDILVEIGTDDEYIGLSNKQECIDRLVKSFPNANISSHIIADADHSFRNKEHILAGNAVGWLTRS